jgi:protein TonB
VALERHRGSAFLASVAAHLTLGALALLAMRSAPPRHVVPTGTDVRQIQLVWMNEPGPGGGGGGGGDGTPEPPRRAELPGRDIRTVPTVKPRAFDSVKPEVEPEPVQQLVIPVVPMALGTEVLPGAIDALPATASQGPGADGGAGTGIGPGDGPGRGRGLGNGRDRGTGGESFQPGADVTMPVEIRKGSPQYTPEAMRARAQGAIMVECLVQTTGVCANIRVKQSFNPTFGLDQEAIKAATQWRFRPGMRRGEPVPVLVTMEIAFTLR